MKKTGSQQTQEGKDKELEQLQFNFNLVTGVA